MKEKYTYVRVKEYILRGADEKNKKKKIMSDVDACTSIQEALNADMDIEEEGRVYIFFSCNDDQTCTTRQCRPLLVSVNRRRNALSCSSEYSSQLVWQFK